MKNKNDIILATNSDGIEVTIGQVNNWIVHTDKENLAHLIYDRLYGRYIKPFDYQNKEYKKEFKSGFTIMANSCLLIETFVSFLRPEFKNTNGKSEKCFGWFFNEFDLFKQFSKDGLVQQEYLKNGRVNNKGLPRDFYVNVRCGILHNGETRNGWKIRRDGVFFDEKSKTINSTTFLRNLDSILSSFRQLLINSDFSSTIWTTYINRLNDIISKS